MTTNVITVSRREWNKKLVEAYFAGREDCDERCTDGFHWPLVPGG